MWGAGRAGGRRRRSHAARRGAESRRACQTRIGPCAPPYWSRDKWRQLPDWWHPQDGRRQIRNRSTGRMTAGDAAAPDAARGAGATTSDYAAAAHSAADRFLRALEARGSSPNTIRSYRTGLEAYLAWLAGNGVDWRSPTRTILRSYLAALTEGHGRRTVAQRLAAIRSFYRFTTRQGLTPGNPLTALATPRQPRRLPAVLVRCSDRAAHRGRGGQGCGAGPHDAGDRRTCRGAWRCATWQSWRRPMRPACASASWPRSTVSSIDLKRGRGTGHGQGTQAASLLAGPAGSNSAGGLSGRRPATSGRPPEWRLEAGEEDVGETNGTVLFLNHLGGPLGVRGMRYRLDRLSALGRVARRCLAAHASTQLRDAPARRRGGPPRRSGVARSREPGHDPDLHPRLAGQAAGRVHCFPPAGAASWTTASAGSADAPPAGPARGRGPEPMPARTSDERHIGDAFATRAWLPAAGRGRSWRPACEEVCGCLSSSRWRRGSIEVRPLPAPRYSISPPTRRAGTRSWRARIRVPICRPPPGPRSRRPTAGHR